MTAFSYSIKAAGFLTRLPFECGKKLGSQGLEVKSDELRNLLGLSHPVKGDSLVGGRLTSEESSLNQQKINLNAQNKKNDDVIDVIDELLEAEQEAGWIKITDEIESVLQAALDKADDYEQFQAELDKLLIDWDMSDIAKTMATSFFKSRAEGDAGFKGEQ
ncbi:MAG: hypothetical protein ACRC5H_01405 [Treponemataceae bacterium]